MTDLALYSDGASGENKNKKMMWFLAQTRSKLRLKWLSMQTGCPHHWNDIHQVFYHFEKILL